jgi:hypothetical protein
METAKEELPNRIVPIPSERTLLLILEIMLMNAACVFLADTVIILLFVTA